MSFMLLGILNAQVSGGGGGAFDLLETTTLASSASSVTFSGLDALAAGYQHLQLRMVTKENSDGSTLLNTQVTFNSNTGANYSYHYLNGSGSTVSSNGATSTASISIIDTSTRTNDIAGAFGASIIDILDFSSATKNTTLRALSGAIATSEKDITLSSGAYFNTEAITSIELNATVSFLTGSRFSLYGVK